MELNSKRLIAANRFCYGIVPTELAKIGDNPQAWLKAQLTPVTFNTALPTSGQMLGYLAEYRRAKKAMKQQGKSIKPTKAVIQRARQLSIDGTRQAIATDNSLAWRLLDFFSNHFSVTAQGRRMTALAPTLEREAIAPNLFGSFEALLLSVIKHPAMLIYLNNDQSAGNQSKLARKGKGLNENLAREILELHTLGVDGGYDQADVIALANGISGWSVKRRKNNESGFFFRRAAHQPTSQTLLTIRYKQQGIAQGESMLLALARSPATAHHICYKLVQHFISDEPQPQLVATLLKRWQQTNGNIKQVMQALIDAPQAWLPAPSKYKTPRDFVISTHRLLAITNASDKQLRGALKQLGQQPFKAASPAGYSDTKEHWNGENALMTRVDWSSRLVKNLDRNTLDNLAPWLKAQLSQHSYTLVMRAESRQHALALALLSPEFQRR